MGKMKISKNNKKTAGMPSWVLSAIVIATVVIVALVCIVSLVNSTGFIPRMSTAMETDNFSINQNMMDYFYHSAYSTFVSDTTYTSLKNYCSLNSGTNANLALDEQVIGAGQYDSVLAPNYNDKTWHDFFMDKAIANATASNATKNDTLRIGTSTTQTTKDATDEVNGSNKVESTFVAAAINADGKIVAMSSDCVEVSFSFDEIGASTFNTSKAVLSKKEQGSNYGMTNPLYGGTSSKEWFEQAAVFDAACIGKTVSEISSLIGDDGKGNSDLQSAGCTISVSGFVKAAEKLK